MNLFSIIILTAVLIWIAVSIRYIHKNKDKGCSGDCGRCGKQCISRKYHNCDKS
ncbi:FeoB-associated Cys-rich membrane protein [uncultured Clostridium sp.]|uniref:FeoB-associated Cys-rich membrane protein n=1 Tax=uncultured Clostridium sp. TaxID=59620 RepID=UPI0025EAF5CB|nr:FeoB-associated Cys-rich membrane protein [uncultured Clostridium sp.]